MVDLHSILADHRTKKSGAESSHQQNQENELIHTASFSDIPELFFDRILVDYKLNRMEILVLMYIYRKVWGVPNLHQAHGISQMMSHTEMAKLLGLTIEEVYGALRKLEEYDFIKTIRAGQYFSRRYFTKENDQFFGQSYDDFEI